MANQDYSELITKYSKKYGVPEKLIRQLINVESSGNASAQSPTGPVGLMQVSTAVAKEAGYSKKDMYDPEKNIDAGTKYLANNLNAFNGNVAHALLGYNQGTGGAKQMIAGKKPMAQEGYNYIHNKKFSPEYLKQGASIPKPSNNIQQTEDLIGFGKQAMKPEIPQGYQTSSMMAETPEEPEEQEVQKEPSDADKINAMANQVRSAFSQVSNYKTSMAQGVRSSLMDIDELKERMAQDQEKRQSSLGSFAKFQLGGQ